LLRSLQRLDTASRQALVVHLGERQLAPAELAASMAQVAALMATELQLAGPPVYLDCRRDEWMLVASELGLLITCQGRIAADMARLSDAGLMDLGRRTPDAASNASAMVISAAARRAPHWVAALMGSQWQEQDLDQGGWQMALAEWRSLLMSAHGAARATAELVRTTQVNTQAMRDEVDSYRGSLSSREAAQRLGPDAQALLAQQTREQGAAMQAQLDCAVRAMPPAASKRDLMAYEAPALVLA